MGRLRYVPWVGHLLGYARVSTAEQSADLQVDELTAAGCWKVWTDSASGVLDRRPQLDQVLEQLRPGDTLVVWRLDRLGRSLRHLIDVVTGLDERGVGFRSLRENIDTTTAGGRLVFHLFGALAQFEREIIRDRTIAGLAAARARGRQGGRPSKLTAEQRRQARKMYDARELTVEQIGQVSRSARCSTSAAPLYTEPSPTAARRRSRRWGKGSAGTRPGRPARTPARLLGAGGGRCDAPQSGAGAVVVAPGRAQRSGRCGTRLRPRPSAAGTGDRAGAVPARGCARPATTSCSPGCWTALRQRPPNPSSWRSCGHCATAADDCAPRPLGNPPAH